LSETHLSYLRVSASLREITPLTQLLFVLLTAAAFNPSGAQAADVQNAGIEQTTTSAIGHAAVAHADYYECIDRTGARYRVRQHLSDKYQAFFQACEPMLELVQPDAKLDQANGEGAVLSRGHGRAQAASIAFPQSSARERATRRAPLRSKPSSKPSAELDSLFRRVADEYRIDAHLLAAIAHVESRFDMRAVSPKGALGLMQVMPATGQRYGVSEPQMLLTDAAINLRVSAEYLRDLADLFDARLDLVLAAYNAGEGAVRRYGDRVPPFAETKSYVAAVLRTYDAFKAAADAAAPSAPLSSVLQE
jgi:hypothetical protein